MSRLLIFVLLTVTSAALGKEIPLQLLFMIASHHPTTVLCNRVGTVTTYLTKGNIRHVTFTSQLHDGESPGKFFLNKIDCKYHHRINLGDLCNCLYQNLRYDKNWLQGATASCESNCKNETIILKGEPDRFYSPNPPKDLDQPLEQMQGLYSRSPALVFFNTTCYVKFEEDAHRCIHFMMKCITSEGEIANGNSFWTRNQINF